MMQYRNGKAHYNLLEKFINLVGYKITTNVSMLNLFGKNSYLRESGWVNSFFANCPVDNNRDPIPWYSYAALDFLKSRLNCNMTVYEYGSGNSTLWWAKRVSKVYSCEHNLKWYNRMLSVSPSNVNIVHAELDDGYENDILKYNKLFDIVVIDGRNRVNCSYNVIAALKHDGVIIWDNSERDRYVQGTSYLRDCGYRSIDFTSIGPLSSKSWRTSIFYANDNCLGI